MGHDLDSILVSEECPRCGKILSAPWGTVRLTKALACSCGALIRLDVSGLPLEAVQRIIDEAGPQLHGEND